MQEQDSNSMVKNIASSSGAISYLTLCYVSESVKTGITTTSQQQKMLPITGRSGLMSICTWAKPTGLAAEFLDYMHQMVFKGVVTSMGYISNQRYESQQKGQLIRVSQQ